MTVTKPVTETKEEIFRCSCHSLSHIFDVSYFASTYNDHVDKEVLFQVLLNPNYRFRDKLVNAFKYLFGKWDRCWVASICINDVNELKRFRNNLNKYIKLMEKKE